MYVKCIMEYGVLGMKLDVIHQYSWPDKLLIENAVELPVIGQLSVSTGKGMWQGSLT